MNDIPWIDAMQKAHSRQLGFLPTQALIGKVKLGQVIVAEVDTRVAATLVAGLDDSVDSNELPGNSVSGYNASQGSRLHGGLCPTPIGYLMAADRYFKRDEIGYITQLCVLPEYRRSLVAGQLLQYQFDRSAYGCNLYACWCAQDLQANEFWESMGFSAIAFRSGAKGKGDKVDGKRGSRVHIFWQKRIRGGDATTPWWYPSTTGGGEMREDRLVFPIPAGVSWRDVSAIEINGGANGVGTDQMAEGRLQIEHRTSEDAGARRKTVKPKAVKVLKAPRMAGGLWFEEEGLVVKENTDSAKEPKAKIDPRLMSMARELRDRWSERSHEIVTPGRTRYDVKRVVGLEAHGTNDRLLSAA